MKAMTNEELQCELEQRVEAVGQGITSSKVLKDIASAPRRSFSAPRMINSDYNDLDRKPRNREAVANEKNLNDVCFGCDGSCGDTTCESKRSSRASAADVESNDGGTNSPYASPQHTLPGNKMPAAVTTTTRSNSRHQQPPQGHLRGHCDLDSKDNCSQEGKGEIFESDSNQNMVSSSEQQQMFDIAVHVTQDLEDSENGNNGQSNYSKWLPRSPKTGTTWESRSSPRTQKKLSPKSRGKKKRLLSNEEEDSVSGSRQQLGSGGVVINGNHGYTDSEGMRDDQGYTSSEDEQHLR